MVLDAQHVGANAFATMGEAVAVALELTLVQHDLVIAQLAALPGINTRQRALPLRWMCWEGYTSTTRDSSRLYFYPYTAAHGPHADELEAPLLPQALASNTLDRRISRCA